MRNVLILIIAIGICGSYTPHVVTAQGGTVAPTTPADITGDGSAHQLVSAGGTARWVSVIAQSGNAAVIRLGDSTTSSSRGQPIAAGGTFFFPALPADSREAVNQHFYNLGAIYYYAASSDKISVMWGN